MSQKTFGFGDGITSLEQAFLETSITSTPKMIVARNVTDFSLCFSGCASLTTIPQGLFDNCTNVTNFSGCFGDCASLTSALPDVWNKDKFPKVTDGAEYAYGCTKAANYNEVPSDFGGPAQ